VITEPVAGLVDAGVITGPVVTSWAMGTRRLYDLVDDDPRFAFHPVEYVCDPVIIAGNERMVSVTRAFAIDLTGQACTESLDGELYGGISTGPAFHRGALASPGGMAIVVVGPSERERIVAASSYYLSPATGLAEVAYMVDPEWQGAGLGGLLHARMFEYARERGVRGFRADVLVGNTRMMRVFQRAGHQLSVKTSAGIEEVTMLFPEHVPEQLH
jgi:GNAT superfamily N-acetyltransferase